ncbi:MAG: tripartite tricarboxylate transporter permease, partial [Rhodospirillales bacterium]|nr:tripartite tricarboxylate transporter permease [Rhodospirillales bacterium]
MEVIAGLIAYLTTTGGFVLDATIKFANPEIALFVVGGTLLGISIGMLPGLTATMGVALLTTLTYRM